MAKLLYELAKSGSYACGFAFAKRSRIAIADLCIDSLSSNRWVFLYRLPKLLYEAAKSGSYACEFAFAKRSRIANADLCIASLSWNRWVLRYSIARLSYESAKSGSYISGYSRHNSTLIDTHSSIYASHLVNWLLSYKKQ